MKGQISEIELTKSFISVQISKEENEKNKNEKIYRTLGAVIGMVIVIILI